MPADEAELQKLSAVEEEEEARPAIKKPRQEAAVKKGRASSRPEGEGRQAVEAPLDASASTRGRRTSKAATAGQDLKPAEDKSKNGGPANKKIEEVKKVNKTNEGLRRTLL
jgi:hypothetical protein